MRKATAYDKRLDRQLTREVRHAFKVERRRRCAAAGEAIERALADKKPKQAWQQLQSWYKSAGDRPVKPCREDLVSLTQERIELYRRKRPPGDPIPVMVEEFAIDDSPPSDGEISDAVARLPSGKAAGASGMRVDHFKAWKHEATRDKDPDSSKWDLLVKLVQLVYETGTLPAQASWMIVVLLPKPDGGVRGIGLVEALWKLIASVVNARLQSSIVFHDSLHGFRPARGCGTAVYEAKLFQQLAGIDGVAVYEVFLDLRKAYDAVDRSRLEEILKGYGVGPSMLRLL